MRNLCVIGAGYVGLTTGACFADLGNRVTLLDIDEPRIQSLRAGQMPIYEPGLEELVRRNVKFDRLTFTTDYAEALADAEFVFIAVNTPSRADGGADLRYLQSAAASIARHLTHPLIIINKSTGPVGAGDLVADIIAQHKRNGATVSVVSNPEFLREGSAIADFLNPDRVVFGSRDPEAAQRVAQLYLPLRARIMITDLRTAELIKYASNAFLATKISFINEIAAICEKLGADVKEVAEGMGLDKRIGRAMLDAGLGYGGSCFPKDVKALEHMAAAAGCHPQLLRAVMEINQDQRWQIIRKLKDVLGDLRGKSIGLLGLAFKPNTDDMREAASVDIAQMLQAEGARVKGYDPVSMAVAAKAMPEMLLCEDPYELAERCDAVIVVTEWNEFKQLDLERLKRSMKKPVLVDGRNIYDPEKMDELGFIYLGTGRGYPMDDITSILSVHPEPVEG
ncbi:MAG: UDP-glucose/GDP-mannose dehydrogenase family protein [Chloroflexi bacterium]|nr:UDP-glucose/GDP-mannose dehydrogenase family protein [Chloroflexota bacterium]